MLPAFVKRGQVSNIYRSMVRQAVEKADPAKRKFADREEWKSVLAVLQEGGKLIVGASDVISLPVPAEE